MHVDFWQEWDHILHAVLLPFSLKYLMNIFSNNFIFFYYLILRAVLYNIPFCICSIMYLTYFLFFSTQWHTFREFSGFHYRKQFCSGKLGVHAHPCFLSWLQASAWAGLTGARFARLTGGPVSGWGACSSSASNCLAFLFLCHHLNSPTRLIS